MKHMILVLIVGAFAVSANAETKSFSGVAKKATTTQMQQTEAKGFISWVWNKFTGWTTRVIGGDAVNRNNNTKVVPLPTSNRYVPFVLH